MMQPVLDPVTVTAPVSTITLPLAMYLGAWVIGGALIVWGAIRLLKARAEDGSPLLFWFLRQIPKVEMLFALGGVLWLATGVVVVWKLAFAGSMGPHFAEWMISLGGLVGLGGGIYGVQRATFKREAAEFDAAQNADGAP